MDEDQSIPPPQLIVDHFSLEQLNAILSRNNGQVLGAFDEITSFYGQLDLFKHTGSTIDRKTLLSLNSGSSGAEISGTILVPLRIRPSISPASFSQHLPFKC